MNKFLWKEKDIKILNKNKLQKSQNIHIDNIEWKRQEGNRVKQELEPLLTKIKSFLNLKQPIIIHLYKNKEDNKLDRAQLDENIIILYEHSPDFRSDCLHELGHMMFHKWGLDNNTIVKVKLDKLRIQIRKEKNHLFLNEHTSSNIKEVFATIFKWYIEGMIIDKSYLEMLRNNCACGFKLIDDVARENIKKSFNPRSMTLLKAFIKPKLTAEGRIDFHSIPIGATVWVTIEGRHIPITRYSSEKFAVDFQAARNAGYNIQFDKTKSHLTFKVNAKKDKLEKPKEEKQLTERQLEKVRIKEEIKTKKKETRKEIDKSIKDSRRAVLKEVTNKEKENKELESIATKLKTNLDKNDKLSEEQKEQTIQTVLSEVLRRKKQSKIKDCNKLANYKEVQTDKKDELYVNIPNEYHYGLELVNDVKNELNNEEGIKITFNSGLDKQALENKSEIRKKTKQYIDNLAKKESFEKEYKKVNKEKYENLMNIKIEGLEVSKEDVEEIGKRFDKISYKNNSESLYTVLSKLSDGDSLANINLLINKAGTRQVNALTNKFLDINMDFKRLIEGIGLEKSMNLLAMHLRNTLDKNKYEKFIDNIESYFESEVEHIENNALDKIKGLKKEAQNLRTKITQVKVFNKEAERSLVDNLIEQRNILGSSLGLLKSTSELLNSLKKIKNEKDISHVDIELSKDPDKAKIEYKNMIFSTDRNNAKLELHPFKNRVVLSSNLLSNYIKINKIDKERKDKLNKIKNNSTGVLIDKQGNEYTNYKIHGFKSEFKFKPHQRNDVQFLNSNGGKGIISRGVGTGKTMIAVGFHATQLVKDPKYSTVMVIPDKNVKQQVDEIKKYTNLKVTEIPEDMDRNQKRKLLQNTSANGNIFVISHTDLVNNTDILSKKKIDNLTIDEPHEIFFDKNGDIKTKGREIISGLKTKHKIALTATPIQENPSDVYNLINWVDPDGVGKRGNFKLQFGDKEKYDINGMLKTENYSFIDMNLGQQNLMKEYYRDIIDNYVTNDQLTKRGYKINKKLEKTKMLPEMNVYLKKKISNAESEMKKFIKNTPQYFKESYPGSWEERRKQTFINNLVAEQIKESNKYDGIKNPKTKQLVKNIFDKINEKHVIYVDDINHQEHITKVLLDKGYPKEQLFSMLGKKKEAIQNKLNWNDSENPGLLFISKGQVAGHNLQKANTLHKVGTLFDGMGDIQVDGRITRGNRKEDANIISYKFSNIYEENLNKKLQKYKRTLASIDTSLEGA